VIITGKKDKVNRIPASKDPNRKKAIKGNAENDEARENA